MEIARVARIPNLDTGISSPGSVSWRSRDVAPHPRCQRRGISAEPAMAAANSQLREPTTTSSSNGPVAATPCGAQT